MRSGDGEPGWGHLGKERHQEQHLVHFSEAGLIADRVTALCIPTARFRAGRGLVGLGSEYLDGGTADGRQTQPVDAQEIIVGQVSEEAMGPEEGMDDQGLGEVHVPFEGDETWRVLIHRMRWGALPAHPFLWE